MGMCLQAPLYLLFLEARVGIGRRGVLSIFGGGEEVVWVEAIVRLMWHSGLS